MKWVLFLLMIAGIIYFFDDLWQKTRKGPEREAIYHTEKEEIKHRNKW